MSECRPTGKQEVCLEYEQQLAEGLLPALGCILNGKHEVVRGRRRALDVQSCCGRLVSLADMYWEQIDSDSKTEICCKDFASEDEACNTHGTAHAQIQGFQRHVPAAAERAL